MILLLFTVFGIIIFLIFILFIAHKMTKPDRNVGDWTPRDLGLEYDEIAFKTEDGLNLKGWWMDKGSEKTLICLHGYTASRWYEVYMKPLLNILKEEKYNILFFDFRAHGKSEGNRTSFGLKEHLGLKASIDWLEKNHEEGCEKIGIIGYSMGALVAIRGISSEERIDCAVADSPPMDIDSTSARSLKYFAGIPPFLYRFVKPVVRSLFGIETQDTYKYMSSVDKPLLLIAGENDPLIDISEIRKFYDGCKDCVELWTTESEHVRSIKEDFKEYENKILSFFKEHL